MKRSFRLTVLAVAALWCVPALGVVWEGGNGNITGYIGDNLASPVPGWNYVGTITGVVGSVVYLGDGWALTAGHVTGTAANKLKIGSTVEFGGIRCTVAQVNTLVDPFNAKEDIALLKLSSASPWTDLPPTLNLSTSLPDPDTFVYMIGNGQNRTTALANNAGYNCGGAQTLRWGTNFVADEYYWTSKNEFGVCFTTRFDQGGSPYEAHASIGDSGGGVFDANGTLLGIMIGVDSYTATYGELTYILDVSRFLPQIFAKAPELEPVPEPATLTMLLAMSAVVVLRKRRTR